MEYFSLEQFPLCIEYCKQWLLTKEDKEEWCSQKIELFRRIALLPTKSKLLFSFLLSPVLPWWNVPPLMGWWIRGLWCLFQSHRNEVRTLYLKWIKACESVFANTIHSQSSLAPVWHIIRDTERVLLSLNPVQLADRIGMAGITKPRRRGKCFQAAFRTVVDGRRVSYLLELNERASKAAS